MEAKRKLLAINNLYALRRYKRYLRKKVYIRERLFNKHLKDFQDNLSAENILKETFKALKLEGTIWQLIPKLFSGQKLKQLFIPIFSGLGAAITSSFLYKEKQKNKIPVRKITTSEPYKEDEMFI